MNIDIQTEDIVTLREAAEHLPRVRRGRKLHQATIYRWVRNGRRGVLLESLQVGGTLCTSLQALQRFFDALSHRSELAQPGVRTPLGARREGDREILERAGIVDTPVDP